MENIRKIISIYFKRIFKNPGLILLWLCFPFVLVLLQYAAFGPKDSGTGLPKIDLVIIDNDKSFVSQGLYQIFQRDPLIKYFKTEYVENESKMIKLFERNHASAAIIIPKDLQSDLLDGKKIIIQFIKNPSFYFTPLIAEESFKILINMANRFLAYAQDSLQLMKKYRNRDFEPTEDEVASISRSWYKASNKVMKINSLNDVKAEMVVEKENKIESTSEGSSTQIFFSTFFPGLIFFSLTFLAIELQQIIFRDKRYGIMKRLLTTPVSRDSVIAGYSSFIYIILVVYAGISFLIGALFLNIRSKNPAHTIISLLGFCLFCMGLAKIIYAQSKSEKAAGSIAPAIFMIVNLIGGGLFPVAFYPESMQGIAKFSPLGIANVAIVDSLTRGSSISEMGIYLGGTWIWGLLIAVTGYLLERRGLKSL